MAFVRAAPVWGAMWGAAALIVGCVDDDGASRPDSGSAMDGGGDATVQVDATPSGDASLRFQAVWGEAAGMQIDAEWRDDVPGWEPEATLVVMLCATDDATCESPVLAREVTADETDGVPLAPSEGPTATLEGLPEGTFLLMVLADSSASRDRGYGWDDDFPTTETAWGGMASEGDLLVSASDDPAAAGHNPAPAPVEVTLSADATADVGTLVLGHYHERDVSPAPGTEDGVLAVAVDDGLRLLDLSAHALLEAGGPGEYTAVMTDSSGDPVDGTVCGLVRGPSTTVFLLYRSPAGGGFAIQYDVATRMQMNGGNRVVLPGGASDTPCRGLYHQFGGNAYLFVANAPASPDQPPSEGLWYARISSLFSSDVTAGFADESVDRVLGIGIAGMAADEDTIYVAISPASTDSRVPSAARGRHDVAVGSLAGDGRPSFEDPFTGAQTILRGPSLGAGLTTPETIPCDAELGTTSLALAEHHDGRPLLFLGGCLEIAVFDLSEDPPVRLDYNGAAPGEPNLDGSMHGQGFAHFALAPDGQTLWAIPQRSSPRSFFVPTGDGSPIELDRRTAFPIDLSTGDRPELRPGFAQDIDGYEGHPGSGLATPAEDPGLDLGYVTHQRYVLEWAPSLGGETFGPSVELDGAIAAPGDTTLWVAVPGGMGKARDLASYDLATLRGHLWPHVSAPFYGIWTGGPDVDPPFGFDAAPESPDPMPVHGIAVVH